MEGLLWYLAAFIDFVLMIWFLWLHHVNEKAINRLGKELHDARQASLNLVVGTKKLIDAHHKHVELLEGELARVKEFIEIPEPEVKSETKPEKPKPIPTPSSGTVLAKKPRKKKSAV